MTDQQTTTNSTDTSPAKTVYVEAPHQEPTFNREPPRSNRFFTFIRHNLTTILFTGFMAINVAALGALSVDRGWIKLPTASVSVVTFDPVKFMNAQRAAASVLVVRPSAEISLMLTQVARQAEAVILDEAQGAVVIIKQALVVPDSVPDITDRVLQRFGLPTDVPTVDTQPKLSDEQLEMIAPTNEAFSSRAKQEDKQFSSTDDLQSLEQQLGIIDTQKNLIP